MNWRETRSRGAYLRRVFTTDTDGELFHCLVSRLCVLYEDSKIEVHAAAAENIDALDVLQPKNENVITPDNVGFYRRLYFLRRLIGTLVEFADCISKLHREAAFKRILMVMEKDLKELWEAAVDYFKTEEALLTKV
jgi:hypothetical protein